MKIETERHYYQVLYFCHDEYAVYRIQAGNIGRVTVPSKDIKALNRLCRSMAKKDGVSGITE